MLYSLLTLEQSIERDDLISRSEVMGELRTKKRQMRWDGGNHYAKLGLQGISCRSQLTISDSTGTSLNPPGNYPNSRSSKPSQSIHTPDFSYPLVSSISFSSSSPISLFLIHNTTIIVQQNVKSSLSITPCHDHLLTRCTALRWVQHIPSTAYTG